MQARLGVTEDGIWGAETQAAWDRMRDGGTKQASIRTILNKDNQIGIQHHEKNPSLKDSITSVMEESWQMDKSLQLEIDSSKLKTAEKERAIKFISELDDTEKKLLLDLIDEKGTSKILSYNKLIDTAEEIIKNRGERNSIDAKSPLNKEESLFRPRVYPETSVSGVSYSEYYFDNGEYCFDVSYKGKVVGTVYLGKNLPIKTELVIGTLSEWDVIAREFEKYARIVASGIPEKLVEGGIQAIVPEVDVSPLFHLPAWEQMMDYMGDLWPKDDKLSFIDTKTGDIVVHAFAEYPPGFLSKNKLQDVIYIAT